MYPLNKNLAKIFKDMSVIYAFHNEKDRFRSIAYENAARIIENIEEDISTYSEKELEDLRGIGHGIATKVEEFIATGRIKKYDELKVSVPIELIRLVSIKGLGVKTLKRIHENLNVNTKTELIRALKDGRVSNLKGFGEKRVGNMLKVLKLHSQVEERILLWDAMEIGNWVVDWMKKLDLITEIEIAGSVRRCRETIGDLDILVSCEEKHHPKVIKHFMELDGIKEILLQGETKASVIIDQMERQVDLRIVEPEEWGSALAYFTGSKQHNVHIRSLAKSRYLKINEYGVFNSRTNERITGRSEENIYRSLELQWIPPEIREDKGEIEIAAEHSIPALIQLKDIKGDLHLHSLWSDGLHSIEEMVSYFEENFSYDYIAITDHSKSLRIAGGINEEELVQQIEKIKMINGKLGKDYIKTGIEVEILSDGSLDLRDEVLEQLDWVVAAIHTEFDKDNTDRLIRACESPCVHVIGHPTGRMIGTREAYPVNMEKLMETALATGTALELNAQPQRMDLNDHYVKMAKEKGVKLVISTDGHTYSNFHFIKMGVGIARRAWCTKEDILNTWSWSELKKYFEKKKLSATA